MDLLASLHLDELPEQQTRISHLEEALADDPDIQLGFNACCACASRSPTIECRGCRRVKYCSDKCRKEDANRGASISGEDEDQAMGHTSVVCALLRLCQDDEDADDSDLNDGTDVNEAAHDRLRSEYESYPATLANILLDGPCYKVMIARVHGKKLVIHVIGASVEAELWGRKERELDAVWDAYAEALQELVETNRLKAIQLCMIGPECPEKNVTVKRQIPFSHNEESCQLSIKTFNETYSSKLFDAREHPPSKPDVVCFFNPGFTCPDYSWNDTISYMSYGTSFIITTNTEMEGIGDCHYLLERQLLPSLPPVAAEIVGTDLVDDNSDVLFGENPFAGIRVRQSGTMANDLFVKNRWMLAGVFNNPAASTTSEKKKSKRDEHVDDRPTKKHKSGQNAKRTNPALI